MGGKSVKPPGKVLGKTGLGGVAIQEKKKKKTSLVGDGVTRMLLVKVKKKRDPRNKMVVH